MDEAPLIGVVVVTHGQLATELVNAAEMIVGELRGFAAVSIGWQDDPEIARDAVARAIERVEGAHGVLVVTDMFGGTPSNIALTFLKEGRVEIISGVNLPMLIKLTALRSSADLIGVARDMREYARDAIRVASDLLRSGGTPAKS